MPGYAEEWQRRHTVVMGVRNSSAGFKKPALLRAKSIRRENQVPSGLP